MDLIEHSNADVRRQALQCISKIMVNKWEFVR
jgi:V-type H+-transporting ATPase subunit H